MTDPFLPQQGVAPRLPPPVAPSLPPVDTVRSAVIASPTAEPVVVTGPVVYRPSRGRLFLAAPLGAVGLGLLLAAPAIGGSEQWTTIATGALMLWGAIGMLAAVLGEWCEVSGDHVRVRSFAWFRFRTFAVRPGTVVEFHRVRQRGPVAVTQQVVRFSWPGRRGTRKMLLNAYPKRDRAAITRAVQRLSRGT